jgi:hypothetical protein
MAISFQILTYSLHMFSFLTHWTFYNICIENLLLNYPKVINCTSIYDGLYWISDTNFTDILEYIVT